MIKKYNRLVMNKKTTWIKRLINYIVDTASLLLLFFLLLRELPVMLKNIPFDFSFDINIVLAIVFVAYYLIFEGVNGKTIGKYLTRTKVVSINGKKPKFTQIIIRTLVRILFIEVLSYIAKRPNGWHDRVSNTEVIAA